MPRPFEIYRRRALRIVGAESLVGAVLATLAMVPLGWLLPAGLLMPAWLVLFALWQLEVGLLAGNRRLRHDVAERLRGFGHLVDTGADRFVGLAYPCYFGHERRLVESDDDVGFLSVEPAGLVYCGDGDEFTIAADNIASVRLLRDPGTLFLLNRVVVETRDGEPHDRLIFDSRHHRLHSVCNRDNLRLAAAIRAIMRPASSAPPSVRLASPEQAETVSGELD